MEKIQPTFNFQVIKSRRSQKGDLIDEFLLKLNPGRIEYKLPPLTFARICRVFKERGMDEQKIYVFLQECKKASHFEKYYYWAIKNKWIKI